MSFADKVLDALRNAILLESRVANFAGSVGELAKDVRDMDRRLVRLETLVEIGARRGSSGRSAPSAIDDGR